jgi:hypothetical protein
MDTINAPTSRAPGDRAAPLIEIHLFGLDYSDIRKPKEFECRIFPYQMVEVASHPFFVQHEETKQTGTFVLIKISDLDNIVRETSIELDLLVIVANSDQPIPP